ncbi:acetyl-CoA carboxylase biotin carboxyl carrier protein [Glacieibacterium frigidum]|uniref:Biotin carboxyl carrier protein of acetyl-CoA carboxylase n=1 Tax=Glacieibacterium frigidum TaxID=2593303 RepID=A0A552UFK6_9SPHN|nr:acetyl-CoA carboxylase biotin carboxyl carrier protein [Glacieibacterium frigidum]TRW17000.1 acetyl-CoA carboxylase biotin carboxyl carrier protein [Glacieibacterium frigidum]
MTEPTTMQVDTALVRELAELLDATKLTEIEVSDGDRKIRVARKAAAVQGFAPASAAAAPAAASAPAAAAAAPATEDWKAHPGLVRSPIVGTAYLTPDPTSPPFVAVGKTVKEGDTLLIVEAMKVMNPIVAPRAGTVVRICIVNEQPVEYDEPLVIIE